MYYVLYCKEKTEMEYIITKLLASHW